jgi:hypothetical protein
MIELFKEFLFFPRIFLSNNKKRMSCVIADGNFEWVNANFPAHLIVWLAHPE